MSLGHKQLEENPWDVFETIFTVDSIHEGTVIDLFDKGAVISLPYGVEGFATPRHLVKEDGSHVKMDEKLEFKVIEFSKSAKRIILVSFTCLRRCEENGRDSQEKSCYKARPAKSVKPVKDTMEKTTLGDISELAASTYTNGRKREEIIHLFHRCEFQCSKEKNRYTYIKDSQRKIRRYLIAPDLKSELIAKCQKGREKYFS